MASPIFIDDPDDERLADYRALKDAELRSAGGAGQPGVFIAEGVNVIRRLVASTYPMRSALVTARNFEVLRDALALTGAPVYVASRDLMRGVAGFDIHRGAVAAGQRLPLRSAQDVVRDARRVAVLEDLTDHENLGSVFRNAAAFGFDAVLVSPRCCDPLYRRAVRVSLGYALMIPFAVLEPWPEGLDWLRAAGFSIYALTPSAAADIQTLSASARERLALMLGTEGPGLSERAIARADLSVKIAMAAGVDSLNVATAGAVAFHHFAIDGH